MKAKGRKEWIIPGGRIPLHSNGPEPAMTSRDELHIVNCGKKDAAIELTVFYSDADPVGPYPLRVAAERVRCVRVNDLIDPLPVPLDTGYALLLRSNVAVVVQFTRVDSSAGANAIATTIGFSD